MIHVFFPFFSSSLQRADFFYHNLRILGVFTPPLSLFPLSKLIEGLSPRAVRSRLLWNDRRRVPSPLRKAFSSFFRSEWEAPTLSVVVEKAAFPFFSFSVRRSIGLPHTNFPAFLFYTGRQFIIPFFFWKRRASFLPFFYVWELPRLPITDRV